MNPLLAGVGGLLGITPLNLNATDIVNSAAAGNPITLQAVDVNGNVVTPTDQCNTQADSFTLRNPAGLAIGGNTISGLGSTGQLASAGEANSIALGNAAATDPAAAGAIALGANATVGAGGTGGVALGTGAQANTPNSVALGAGSVTTRGPLAGYTALGLADPQSSAGEVSVGAAGAPRQITNVAAGTAPTDAVNAGQLAGVAAQVGVLANGAVLYDGAARDRVTLAGAAGTTIANVAPGALTPASTEAVNGAQLGTLGTGVAAALGGGTVYDPAANNLATSLTYAGGQYGSVQAALSAVDSQLAAGFNDSAVIYDGADRATVTLAGRGGTTLTNLRPGALNPTSTDAVTGAQLFATDTNVTNLTTSVQNGSVGPVRYSDAATPEVPNGGVATNDLALVGAAAGPVGLHNVRNGALGTGSTDAVNGGQLATLGTGVAGALGGGSAYDPVTNGVSTLLNYGGGQYGSVQAALSAVDSQLAAEFNDSAVIYDGADRGTVTLAGPGGTTLTNVRAGAVTATSTDAVNGAQLAATNASIANGAVGPVQYSDPGTPTTPNGGVRTNDLTLVGAAPGTVVLHNVGEGSILPGSTDAVNGGQVYALAQNVANAVTYGTDAAGTRTNTVALSGGNAAAPVTVTNVAPAALAAGSTDAVNGGQLYTTNQAVTAAQTTASTALTLGQGSVQYDGPSRTSITLGGGGAAGGGAGGGGGGGAAAPVALRNVAAGTSPTDAVNLSQLSSGMASAVTQANAYTNQQLAAVSFDLRRVKRDANAGTAGALAAAGLPQAYEAGKGMIALAAGTYRGQSAFAFGFSKAMEDGHAVVKVAATYDTRGSAGGSAGMGWQF